jgi:LPXTG-motif cell wall-anchored protein
MVKKLVALSAVLLLAMAGPASAGGGYTDEDTLAVNDSSVTPGQPVTVSAKVFEPGSTVTFTFFSAPVVVGTAVADAAGVATLTFDVPSTATAGTHTIEASGTGADGLPLTVTTTITVAGAAAGGDLPTTGSSNTVSLTQVALTALVGGGFFVLMANKRRSAKADAGELTSV